jgi:hypothetical protein
VGDYCSAVLSLALNWENPARKMRRRLPRVLRRGIVRISRGTSGSRGREYFYLGVVVLPLFAFMAVSWKLVILFLGELKHYFFSTIIDVTAILGSAALWLILVSLLAGIWPARSRKT